MQQDEKRRRLDLIRQAHLDSCAPPSRSAQPMPPHQASPSRSNVRRGPAPVIGPPYRYQHPALPNRMFTTLARARW